VHYQLKITLQDVDPPIWRRVLVPSDFTLFDLHRVIQIVMGWEDCHLHDFSIKRQRYALPDIVDSDQEGDESETRLCDVVRPRSKFLYQYDFGDGWMHDLVVEKAVHDVAAAGPFCVDGERAGPPEDSGGPWGYQVKLEALANPHDEESEELREWIGNDFDAELFERDSVNAQLHDSFGRLRKRRG
jgi:Plasmid pRiA4b ORF-3-like protein.